MQPKWDWTVLLNSSGAWCVCFYSSLTSLNLEQATLTPLQFMLSIRSPVSGVDFGRSEVCLYSRWYYLHLNQPYPNQLPLPTPDVWDLMLKFTIMFHACLINCSQPQMWLCDYELSSDWLVKMQQAKQNK